MAYADTLKANTQYLSDIAAKKTTKTDANSTATAQSKLTGDLNFFLKMLTTQLKNQDPTQPLDTNAMTQQIATLSSVQQQVNTNTNLEKLIGATKQSSLSTAVSYIGREVETTGNTGEILGGQGAFAYSLPKAAATTTVTITNAAGKVVFTGDGTKVAGRNIIVWDGKNSSTGAQEPDGTYTLAVKATDSSGASMTATPSAVGIVTSVQNDSSGDLTLSLGDVTKKFTDVVAVRAPSRVTTSTSTTTGTNNAS